MKATKVTVGDHPWKPYVGIISDGIVYLSALAVMWTWILGGISLPWWLLFPIWTGLSLPFFFDVYQWMWKQRIRRWTMKNSEWLYDELHPRPTHDDI